MEKILFKKHHLEYFTPEPEYHVTFNENIAPEQLEAMETDLAYTFIMNDRIVGCAGLVMADTRTATTWSVLSADSRHCMVGITKFAMRVYTRCLQEKVLNRIQATVRRDFQKGHRWLSLMKFVKETNEIGLQAFDAGNATYDMYALTRNQL